MSFDLAFKFMIGHEGGLVDHPKDPGGATNWGVSLRTLRSLDPDIMFDLDGDGDIDEVDIALLTETDAKRFYRKFFWPDRYTAINHEWKAAKVFDMAVNMGPRQATKIVQDALNDIRYRDDERYKSLVVDGIFGINTIARLNTYNPACVLSALVSSSARFYFSLADGKPARAVFLLGWLRRAYHLPTEI